jgi:hypothetical protein
VTDVLICPYCLAIDTILQNDNTKRFECNDCKQIIPHEYMRDKEARREVISVVGFRGNGKTVYFASLFASLYKLAQHWPGFYIQAVDERGLQVWKENMNILKTGVLPDPTQKLFPEPTILKLSKMPHLDNSFFMFYDTSGEAFEKPSGITNYAKFVKDSRTALFILSPNDMDHEGQSMYDLLATYVQGLSELGGAPEQQHLVVVLTKAETLQSRLTGYEDIWRYFEEGLLNTLVDFRPRAYIKGMENTSHSLERFLKGELKEAQFVHFAKDRFKSVEFSIVSALGAAPDGKKLSDHIRPKRIMDPLLWVMHKSRRQWWMGTAG